MSRSEPLPTQPLRSTQVLRDRFASQACTAKEAIARIQPGQRIFIGSGAAEPEVLVQALVDDAVRFEANPVVHILTIGSAPYTAPALAHAFRHEAFFIGANAREAVQSGRADFMPIFLSDIPALFRNGRRPIDVALISVSPPDEDGFVSLGVSVDIVLAAIEAARMVIAQVNPRMPDTGGSSRVHVSRLSWLVEGDAPLPTLTCAEPDEVELAIGAHVASLVPDGATIQVGIGRVPDAVMRSLRGHHDLGVHTEMLSDGVMDLALDGVITGARKSLLPGKLVTSFLMGSQKLYRWADRNPALEMRPSDFTNDPFVIARNETMISINTALSIDLTGQVAADTIGGRFYSGIGGQVDFVRGAARSANGRSIIALRSTAKHGSISSIQAVFEAGAGIVTSRGDVQTIVTEYGVADLHGKNIRERAHALIELAHPDFRGVLRAQAHAHFFI